MLITALVTPFTEDSKDLDLPRLQEWVAFQLDCGVDRVLLMGTTGEGASLRESERDVLLEACREVARPSQIMVSLGLGRVDQLVDRGHRALSQGVQDLLVVDYPYVGASSTDLRRHHYGPLAEALPESFLVPYVVPSRTSCFMLPEDLARLHEDYPQVVGVKDATGCLDNMRSVRQLLGEKFVLLCGEDGLIGESLLASDIRAHGAVSFAANLAPDLFSTLVQAGLDGDAVAVEAVSQPVKAIASLVSITAIENLSLHGKVRNVSQRYRNPLPLKTALGVMGAHGGPCRPPHGAMGKAGAEAVASICAMVERDFPGVFDSLRRAWGTDAGVFDDLTAGVETVSP